MPEGALFLGACPKSKSAGKANRFSICIYHHISLHTPRNREAIWIRLLS